VSVQQGLQEKLSDALSPLHLDVSNESGMHNVPAGSETHFKVLVVSEKFEGEKLLTRHRKINRVLAQELAGPVHALAIHALTPTEWFERGGSVPDSPPCLGGEGSTG
jgi:BolA protein